MSPGKIPGRRAMLASDIAAAFTPKALDARLMMLAGNRRQAEAHYTALVGLDDAARDDAA